MHGYPITDSCLVGAGYSVHSLWYLAIFITKQICSSIVWLQLKSFAIRTLTHMWLCPNRIFSHCTISLIQDSVYSLWHYTYTPSLLKQGLMNRAHIKKSHENSRHTVAICWMGFILSVLPHSWLGLYNLLILLYLKWNCWTREVEHTRVQDGQQVRLVLQKKLYYDFIMQVTLNVFISGAISQIGQWSFGSFFLLQLSNNFL